MAKKNPIGRIFINKFFENKRTGQITFYLPKRKLKKKPVRIEVRYW